MATSRPALQLSWGADSGLQVVALAPLDREAAKTVARDVVERLGARASPELLDQVLDRADGVPLFIEEITRSLAELSGTEPAPGERHLGEGAPQLPASLADSLMARLDRLGSAKWVVQAAAVIGREAPVAWVAEITAVGEDALRREVARVAGAGLLSERAEPEPTYVFSHALVREAAYQSLPKRAREELHQRVADMLATHYPELVHRQPLLLAHHYIAAGVTASAVRYLRDAGHRTLATSAFVEAIEVFNRAISLLPSIEPSKERDALEIELLSSAGLALISTQGYSSTAVEDVYGRARQLCERFGDVPLRVLYGVWAVHLVRSDARGVNRLAALLLRLLEASQDRDVLLVAHSCLGVRAFYRVQLAEARHHLQLASEQMNLVAPRIQHEKMVGSYGFEGLLTGPVWLGWVETIRGNEAEARRQLRKASQLADRIGDPYIQCQVALYSATLAREWHDVAGARELAARVSSLSAEHDFLFWRALGLCVQGWVTLRTGDAPGAMALAQKGLVMLDDIGSLVNRTYFLSYLVEACLGADELEEGLRAADEALSICRESLGPMYEPELLRLKGALLVASGAEELAIEHFRAALAQSRLSGVRLLEARAARSLAEVLVRRGMRREAEEALQKSCSGWPEGAAGHDLQSARSALAELTGATGS
jgi:tetratricopeptide (TPR) repeat protein